MQSPPAHDLYFFYLTRILLYHSNIVRSFDGNSFCAEMNQMILHSLPLRKVLRNGVFHATTTFHRNHSRTCSRDYSSSSSSSLALMFFFGTGSLRFRRSGLTWPWASSTHLGIHLEPAAGHLHCCHTTSRSARFSAVPHAAVAIDTAPWKYDPSPDEFHTYTPSSQFYTHMSIRVGISSMNGSVYADTATCQQCRRPKKTTSGSLRLPRAIFRHRGAVFLLIQRQRLQVGRVGGRGVEGGDPRCGGALLPTHQADGHAEQGVCIRGSRGHRWCYRSTSVSRGGHDVGYVSRPPVFSIELIKWYNTSSAKTRTRWNDTVTGIEIFANMYPGWDMGFYIFHEDELGGGEVGNGILSTLWFSERIRGPYRFGDADRARATPSKGFGMAWDW